MRRLSFFLIFVISLGVIFSACSKNEDNPTPSEETSLEGTQEPVEFEKIWGPIADTAQNEFFELHWDSQKSRLMTDKQNNVHYWWQAHALDVLFDAYERTGNQVYQDRAKEVYKSIYRLNGRTFINNFYDDMEWMALALLRGYKLTGDEEYKETVLLLWSDIKKGWNSQMGGGIAWQKGTPYYKNTPANMPAAILAVRLYKEFGDNTYLEWANKIYKWQVDTLVSSSGLIWDGINRNNDGAIDKNWLFTYCHGVFIGASCELYDVTKDNYYLDMAKKTGERSLKHFFNYKTGILKSEGTGDGGLFGGIYIRYLTQLALVTKDDAIINALVKNADVVWNDSRDPETGAISPNWGTKPRTRQDLSVQLSGIKLIEAMARLEAEGLLASE